MTPIIVSWLVPIQTPLWQPLWLAEDARYVDDVIDAMHYFQRLGRIETTLNTIAAAVGKDRTQVRGESM